MSRLPDIKSLLVKDGYLGRSQGYWLIVPENNMIAEYDMDEIRRIWGAMEPEDLPRFMVTPWERSNEFRHRVLLHAAKLVLSGTDLDVRLEL